MISKGFQIILIAVMSANLFVTIMLIKKESMRVKYALAWIFISIGTLFIAIFPKTLRIISDKLYIYNDANTLFMFAIIVLFVMAFSFSLLFSKNSYMIQSLAQEIAILKLRINELEKKLDEKNESLKNKDTKE